VRIAILSDIHGNLPALEAVVRDIERRAPDEIWCGGDIAWAGPWASECIRFVRDAGWPTVRGNTDVWITGDVQGVADPRDRVELEAMAAEHAIAEDDARWLLSLPLGHTAPGSILLVHGTPLSPFEGAMPDAPPEDFSSYEGHAALVVCAHVHTAFVRRLSGGSLVCNTGSVGLPKDADTASYLLLDRDGPELTLRHARVAFEREAGRERARAIGGRLGERWLEAVGG
jgi:predicted phosphodiesterase